MSNSESHLISLFQIGIAIHQLNRRSEKYMGLSLVQWCLLKHLIDMPAVPAHSLAKVVGVHPSTLTQTLKRLEKKKYIFIIGDPKDTRKKLISITRLGKEILDSTSEKMTSWSKGFSDISDELVSIQSCLQEQVIKEQS